MADLSATPSAERVHIAFFGRRNAGKSSLVNALTGQSVAIVSPVAGTTTDPVRKSMELLPLGPGGMIDTPGLDDEGEVGSLRVGRALRELNRADIAVLVVDAAAGMADEDRALLKRFEQKGVPPLTVFNKCDLRAVSCGEGELAVSAHTGEGEGHQFTYVLPGERGTITVPNPTAQLAVGTLQNFLDRYLEENGGKVDYIHGEDVVEQLASQPGSIGFLLPAMGKDQLFPTVIFDGALPRKTFSMGEAHDKRFYLEARRIK